MADDILKGSMTGTGQKAESRPAVEREAESKPRRSPGRRWILTGIVVFAVLAGCAAYLAMPHFPGNGTAGANDSRPPGERVKATLRLDPFLVNLADSVDSRFVKSTFQLGLAKKMGDDEETAIAVAAMRDSIITLLSSKTSDQILTIQGKEKLREEIRQRVNAVSNTKILEVYIVDFVVQL